MKGARRDGEIGVDTLREAREDRTDGDEEDEPSAPVPSVVVAVFSVGIIHVADIQFHVADKVVIRDEDTSNGSHETCVTGEEGKKLSTFDDDLPG